MRDLRAGHEYLKSRKFVEAYHYFVDLGKLFQNDPQTWNGCLYGQARARIGLQQPEGAIPLLNEVIKNVPNWASPYIALARIYERQEADCKLQGRFSDAEQLFELANNTYLTALQRTNSNEKLKEHYDYFLKEHATPFAPPSKTFAPGYAASHSRLQAQSFNKTAATASLQSAATIDTPIPRPKTAPAA